MQRNANMGGAPQEMEVYVPPPLESKGVREYKKISKPKQSASFSQRILHASYLSSSATDAASSGYVHNFVVRTAVRRISVLGK